MHFVVWVGLRDQFSSDVTAQVVYESRIQYRTAVLLALNLRNLEESTNSINQSNGNLTTLIDLGDQDHLQFSLWNFIRNHHDFRQLSYQNFQPLILLRIVPQRKKSIPRKRNLKFLLTFQVDHENSVSNRANSDTKIIFHLAQWHG